LQKPSILRVCANVQNVFLSFLFFLVKTRRGVGRSAMAGHCGAERRVLPVVAISVGVILLAGLWTVRQVCVRAPTMRAFVALLL
jgi:hypothetical protein